MTSHYHSILIKNQSLSSVTSPKACLHQPDPTGAAFTKAPSHPPWVGAGPTPSAREIVNRRQIDCVERAKRQGVVKTCRINRKNDNGRGMGEIRRTGWMEGKVEGNREIRLITRWRNIEVESMEKQIKKNWWMDEWSEKRGEKIGGSGMVGWMDRWRRLRIKKEQMEKE